MDLLSDVATSMRAGTPGSARIEAHGPWGWYLPGDPGVAGFMAVLSGTCRLFPDEGEPLSLGPGDIVFSPHGDGYGLSDGPLEPESTLEEARPGEGGFRRYVYGEPGPNPPTVFVAGGYRLDRERSHPLLTALPAQIHVRDGGPAIARVLKDLDEETVVDRPGSDALLPLLLDTLLLYVLRACLDPRPGHGAGGWARALADPGVASALAALHRDPAAPWTVVSLAKEARMSRATFARRFSILTGLSPMRYVTWWRMNTARGLLRDTDLSVEEIASRVGYGSPFAFSHAFRRAHGEAPLRYRRLRRPGAGEGSTPHTPSAAPHRGEKVDTMTNIDNDRE
ncbi:AraC family transcriptional regulator [Nocardiopsis alba]|uniref:Bacterial regulatory helix-turn-helix s, AraC family protein n=1 Tax=Nocardiopsis alba (strain ATCC BAA-2165 / BE74) TaxID=1205910 RepID=J7LIA6_NOCAA|nr:AraC family transcriptional regulator [Nocardiopsis alba]AFR10402.1 bacterial regulatory helix-turn-helix s, AraC family protein [Nocardiopsis alba ATCC BAA-2165]